MRKQLVASLGAVIITVLLGAGIAVAVEAGPQQSPSDSSSSIESSSTSDSSSSDAPKANDDNESESDDSESDNSESDNSTSSEHPDNHGKAVSEAAHSCAKGKGHGKCVAAVAKSDAGK